MMKTVNNKIYLHPVGEVMLVHFARPEPVSDDDFACYCDTLVETVRESKAGKVALLFGEGSPTATQRNVFAKRMKAAPELKAKRVALLTDSVIARGALTAVGWLVNNPEQQMKPFATKDIKAALSWLAEVATFDQAELLRARDRMIAAGQIEGASAPPTEVTRDSR